MINNFFIRWMVVVSMIYLISVIIPGISVNNFWDAAVASIMLAIVNSTIKPIMNFLLFPINLITLGLCYLVINALMLMLTSSWVDGFDISGFGSAFVGSLILSLLYNSIYKQ